MKNFRIFAFVFAAAAFFVSALAFVAESVSNFIKIGLSLCTELRGKPDKGHVGILAMARMAHMSAKTHKRQVPMKRRPVKTPQWRMCPSA